MAEQKKSTYIGVAWTKEGQKGTFFSGQLKIDPEVLNNAQQDEKTGFVLVPFMMFENGNKEKENHPDWNMILSEKKEEKKSFNKFAGKKK